MSRIYLSPPHLSGDEPRSVSEALASNWVAPAGPDLDAFEEEFCRATGARHALALNSGTAALHLALLVAGVLPGDEVLVSSLTVAASVNPILYLGARPTFIDSHQDSWTMDPTLLADTLAARARVGRMPTAVVLVHLYGQSADIDPVRDACGRHGVALIEDAAEALGASYKGRAAGTLGRAGVFSFNGNKIITTGGGGMLVSDDAAFVARARKLSNQAREHARHYEHREVGYNYRLSNVLAAVGRAQLAVLAARVEARRHVFGWYADLLTGVPGLTFMPESAYGRASRWLTVATIDPAAFGSTRDALIEALEREDIESRPTWKPMHLQPAFERFEVVGGRVSAGLFERGICLPSGSALTRTDVERISRIVRNCSHPSQPRDPLRCSDSVSA
jgi:dTDP-4-amino-4,6-dideoxygalactose transaminase